MPGPPPDPNSARSKLRGLTVIAKEAQMAPPDPPEGLLPAVNDAWAAFWTSPLVDHVISSDLPALRRLFGLYDRRERFDAAGVEEVIVTGSQKQGVLNPLLKEVDVLDAKILALEDRFGMSPMSRLKLQVTLGDATRSLADINARIAAAPAPAREADEPDPRTLVR